MSNRTAIQAMIFGWVLLAAFPAGALATDRLGASGPITDRASAGERGGTDTITLDVTGIPSMDRVGSPNNVIIDLFVGPFNEVIGGGFDVFLQTLVPGSRLSDIIVSITNTDEVPGFGFSPAALDQFPGGPNRYMRAVAPVPPQFPTVHARQDGLVRLEFLDGFDEAPGAADGLWVSGSLTLLTRYPIPAPGFAGLLVLSVSWGTVRQKRASQVLSHYGHGVELGTHSGAVVHW